MTLACWQRTITDDQGNVARNALVEVRRESDDGLARLYLDRDGAVPAGNPLWSDSKGFVRFFTQGGAYKITANGDEVLRYEAIGRAREVDGDENDVMTPVVLLAQKARSLSILSSKADLGDLNGVPALVFVGTTSNINFWIDRLPRNYNGGDLRFTIYFAPASGTGDVDFQVRIGEAFPTGEEPDSTDYDDLADTTDIAVGGAEDVLTCTIDVEIDNLDAGDRFQAQLIRRGNLDTNTGDVYVFAVLVEEISSEPANSNVFEFTMISGYADTEAGEFYGYSTSAVGLEIGSIDGEPISENPVAAFLYASDTTTNVFYFEGDCTDLLDGLVVHIDGVPYQHQVGWTYSGGYTTAQWSAGNGPVFGDGVTYVVQIKWPEAVSEPSSEPDSEPSSEPESEPPAVYSFTMLAGNSFGFVNGFGTIAEPGAPFGSIDSEPVSGETLEALYSSFGTATFQFDGDVTAELTGLDLYVDGMHYPGSWSFDSSNTVYAFSGSRPSFTSGATYIIELK